VLIVKIVSPIAGNPARVPLEVAIACAVTLAPSYRRTTLEHDMAGIETRVARIAEALLAERQFVAPIDVLIGLGWLAESNVDRWTKGRVTSLDLCFGVDATKAAQALDALRNWAQGHGLQGWPTEYRELRFTAAGDPATERAFRTRWAVTDDPAPDLPPERSRGLTVLSAHNDWTCSACGNTGDLLVKTSAGASCLDCADLGHLVFLPSGDAALTRRAKKLSRLSAVVVRWSTRRNRYERQGILVENDAIEQAAQQCLDDAEARAQRRDRDQVRRAAVDERFRAEFAAAIRDQFPGCPPGRADAISYHAALRGSGRVGRSAAARALDPDAIRLAVAASVRHVDTDYDELLMSGVDRDDARHRVRDRVEHILDTWRDGATVLDT
jgi:hypothetical protein